MPAYPIYTAEDVFDQCTKKMGCWEFTGHSDRNGYGYTGRDGKKRLAHRVAYQVFYGVYPAGKDVMHICDNPSCINPAHLPLTDAKGNISDAVMKGRMAHGERHCRSVLTEELVDYIRTSGETVAEMARLIGVHECTVRDVLKGRTWRKK
jgi:hypothetical protein